LGRVTLRIMPFVLLLALTGPVLAQETIASREKLRFLDQDAAPRQDGMGYKVEDDQTEVDLGFNPGAGTDSGRAVLAARRHLGDSVTAAYTSEFGADLQDSTATSGADQGLPRFERKDVWSLDWTTSPWLKTGVYNESTGAAQVKDPFQFSTQTTGMRSASQVTGLTMVGTDLRRQQNLQADGGSTWSNIYETKVSQRLGETPFSLEVNPLLRQDYAESGALEASGPRLANALKWQATTSSQVTVGSEFGDRSLLLESGREESQLYFTQYEHAWEEDVSFLLRSDFESVRRTYAAEQDASGTDRRLSLQAGPRFKLTEDFLAQVDMKYGVQENERNRQAETEQAVSVSIRGKF
jgi:hypothetical protein